MGLDMYLNKKTYVQNWDHNTPEQKHNIIIKLGGNIRKDIKPERIIYIEEQVLYWRKANAIHQWFIDNCADGNGDQTEMYVGLDQLKELRDTCKKVLDASKLVKGKIKNGEMGTPTGWKPIMEDGRYIEDPTIAGELLPTTDGFFFGSTDYDEYYYQDIKFTYDELNKIIEEENQEGLIGGEYYYNASW